MISLDAKSAGDGRRKRTRDTRRKIMDATRTLLMARPDLPVAREIATDAGITTRTLFRHFSDMDALFEALVQDADAQANAVMSAPFEDAGDDLAATLDRIIDRRVRVFESLLPLVVSRVWQRSEAHRSTSARRAAQRRRRQRLEQVLPPTCRADGARFEAIDAVLGIEFWMSLRHTQLLEVKDARAALRCAAHGLLGLAD